MIMQIIIEIRWNQKFQTKKQADSILTGDRCPIVEYLRRKE